MADMATTNPATRILQVAIPVPLRRLFDYLIADDYPIEPQAGMRVKVPFGKSSKIGIIESVKPIEADAESDIPLDKLKPISAIIDPLPLVSPEMLRLKQWMQQYYHSPPGEIWQTMLPTALLKGKPADYVRSSFWQITEQGRELLRENGLSKTAVKQKRILELLAGRNGGIAHDQLSQFDTSFAYMKKLAGKRWVSQEFESSENARSGDWLNKTAEAIKLNDEQRHAIGQVAERLGKYACFLLFGVTASGKTEVYLRLIEKVLRQGRQALVLVPEIGLTPQTVKRFSDRFNVEIAVLHSGMTDQQRLQNWLKARNGDAPIVIGTRSALFVPLRSPGIVIIDEEHDQSFRQQQGFRYSARDVAMVRGNLEKIPVVLGSASPSLESLHNVNKHKITRLDLKQKARAAAELSYRVVDLKNQPLHHGMASDLIANIKKHLDRKGQVLLFLNRRGYAPVLLCHECGWSASCSRCDIHYTYHNHSQYLQCHHCGSSRRQPQQCPECQCKEMIPVGLGTERLEESIRSLFPDARVARIDRDTTRRKSAMQDYVKAIKSGNVDILIGTQMLAKGHHFPDVTLVALIDMDGALYSADYRAPEYAAQLITQVSGRAGRADKPGEVLVQTHLAEHPMLHQIINQGYDAFAETALAERVEAELPPHSFSALFQAESPHLGSVKTFLQEARQILDRYSDLKVELLGPAPSVYVKKAGKFRYQLFLQTNNRNDLHRLLDLTINDIEKLKSANRVRWRLEVDPAGDS